MSRIKEDCLATEENFEIFTSLKTQLRNLINSSKNFDFILGCFREEYLWSVRHETDSFLQKERLHHLLVEFILRHLHPNADSYLTLDSLLLGFAELTEFIYSQLKIFVKIKEKRVELDFPPLSMIDTYYDSEKCDKPYNLLNAEETYEFIIQRLEGRIFPREYVENIRSSIFELFTKLASYSSDCCNNCLRLDQSPPLISEMNQDYTMRRRREIKFETILEGVNLTMPPVERELPSPPKRRRFENAQEVEKKILVMITDTLKEVVGPDARVEFKHLLYALLKNSKWPLESYMRGESFLLV